MADYQEQFSDQLIVKLTDEEREWVEKILTQLEPDFADDEPDEYVEQRAFLLEHVDPVVIDDANEPWPQFNWKIEEDGVWMYDDGGCFRAEHVVEFVHAFIKKFRPELIFKMTWAGTCTKPQLGSFGGGWAVVDSNGAAFGDVWGEADKMVKHLQDPWSDDLVQFARLIDEIRATQDVTAWTDLCSSMDLDPEQVDELFDRAHKVWEKAKEERT
jgi:hypothetical protein